LCPVFFSIKVEALLDELDSQVSHSKNVAQVQPASAPQSVNDQHNSATRTGKLP